MKHGCSWLLIAYAISACQGALEPTPNTIVLGDGGVGGAGGTGGTQSTVSFECQQSEVPASVPMRRLSMVQLRNTLQDLLRGSVPSADADAIFADATTILDAFPADARSGPAEHWGGSTRVDQRVAQEHVDRDYDLAVRVGSALTANAARLGATAGACATDADGSNDEACMDAFVRDFGERVTRRGLTDEDITFYKRPVGAAPYTPEDWADVIALLIASPHFFYMVEHGTDDAVGDSNALYTVSAYERASRLSYHFWQTMPDDELLALARNGDLMRDDVYEAQADRLFASPRTRDAIQQFYAEWFRRADVAQLNSLTGTAAFDTLRGDFNPSSELRDAMFDEVTQMALYYTLDTPGHVEDFYRSRKAFPRTQELADYYGVPRWDGMSEPPDFSEPERQGLLTRAAMVATGSANTRPIMKGVFIRRALLCDALPPPPANVMATTPEPVTDATSRQVVENLTRTGVCPTCHAQAINPLGFATENFDALGRPRTEERLIDMETGEVHAQRPVNTAVDVSITNGVVVPVRDAIELQEQMIESGKVQACFARIYFRFTFGRAERVGPDGCALESILTPLQEGRPIVDALRAVASSDAFLQRSFQATSMQGVSP